MNNNIHFHMYTIHLSCLDHKNYTLRKIDKQSDLLKLKVQKYEHIFFPVTITSVGGSELVICRK